MRPILILTAGFGQGHNTAAESLAAALRIERPGLLVDISDVFAEAYRWRNTMLRNLYLAAINRAPAVWAGAFGILDRTPIARLHIGIYRAALRRLGQRIEATRPAVVVSTYPGCGHLLDRLSRARVSRPFRTVTIITDSLAVNSAWHTAHADLFVVAEERTAKILEGRGIPEARVRSMGFPVSPAFAGMPPRDPAPTRGGQSWRLLLVINGREADAMRLAGSLVNLPGCALTVAAGRRAGLERRLRARWADRGVEILGWMPDLPDQLARHHVFLGKAGGATVHECLAASLPMVLTQVVPGQEEGNARLVTEAECAVLATRPGEAAQVVSGMFEAGGFRWRRMVDAARALGRPSASRAIARALLELAQQP